MSRHLDGTGSAHPIIGCLDALDRALDEAADAPTWSLDTTDTTQILQRIATDQARLAELEARALRHAETLQIPTDAGTRSTTAWLARHTHVTRQEAGRKVRLAHALAGHEQTREAMARGEVHAEQALVIDNAVDDLTDDHAHHQDLAEKHLLTQARDFDAHALATLGRRILETIDPAGADEHEARLLEAQEARARKKTTLRLWDDGTGLTHGTFTLPAAQGSMLRKALHGLSSPKHVRATDGAGAYRFETPTPEKLGQAFCTYIERYPRTGSRSSAASPPRSSSPPTTRSCSASTRPPTSTPASPSHPASCAGGPAKPASTPRSSTPTATCSTSAAAPACTPKPNASPSSSSRRPANTPPATSSAPSATSTTSTPGPTAAPPTPGSPPCSAPSTTTRPTPPAPPTPCARRKPPV